MIYFSLFCFVFNKMGLFLQKAYKQIDNYYINQISSERMKKRFVLLLACLLAGIGLAIAQTPKTITGVVISEEDNQPVVGASVLVKGTAIGTTTNVDGKFTISNVPSSARTLKISYIGMKAQEVSIKPGTMKIVMQPDAEVLDEVVVTGMTKVDKRLFTGAADRLTAASVKLDGLPDISRGLEGRSAGVSVQNVSGTFGTAPKIRVRGATSIYGNSKPLWVVDGVIMDDVVEVSADQLSSGDAVTLISSAIAGLNADDIESFQILKDGSATSIYGARAMSGVIVVTTKQGKAGTSRLSYTGEFTMRMKPSYRNFNLMNSQDQMGIYKEMRDKGDLNFASVYRASNSGVYGKMYQLNNWYDKTNGMYGLAQTPEAQNAYLREAEYRNTDWFDLLFSNAIMMNHSVSYATGTEKSTSYVSVSAMVDPGWMLQNKVQRYTANLNNSYKIVKDLSLNVIANASYRQQKAPGTLVTVGFIDPGNWASNFAAGSEFGYALLWVVTLSTIMLIVLQHNVAHLGIVTGLCLSEAATQYCPKWIARPVLGSAVLASISTSLAEILGGAIALQMLLDIPIVWGSILTTLFVIIMLFSNSYKKIERAIIAFVTQ